jgi:hypothetical protein
MRFPLVGRWPPASMSKLKLISEVLTSVASRTIEELCQQGGLRVAATTLRTPHSVNRGRIFL